MLIFLLILATIVGHILLPLDWWLTFRKFNRYGLSTFSGYPYGLQIAMSVLGPFVLLIGISVFLMNYHKHYYGKL